MEQQKTVLIVDDEPDFVEITELALSGKYRCRTAASGEECLKEVHKEIPDLIIMDVMMSDVMDGLETAKALRGQVATQNIPIIMLTGVNQSLDLRGQMEDDFPREKWLDKPVSPEVVLAEVDRLIGTV